MLKHEPNMLSSTGAREATASKTVLRVAVMFAVVSAVAFANLAVYDRLRATQPVTCPPTGSGGADLAPRRQRAMIDAEELLGGDVERVLLIAQVTEQLGKAVGHVDDLLELCLRFNRTCVLPGVANSQFELDGVLGFFDIFDQASIPAEVETVTWERYAKHLRRMAAPRILVCALGKDLLLSRYLTAFQRKVLFYQPNVTFAFDDACSTRTIGWPADRAQQVANLNTVSTVLGRDEPIIAIFHMDWSEPLPKAATELSKLAYAGVDFSADFYARALEFRSRIGDYIHLQWRMEKADGGANTNYTACAVAAVQHVRALARRASVGRLYFSADVGRDGAPWSNSIGTAISKDALNAISLIYDEFPELLTWVNVTTPDLPRYDMAAVGVIDRLIAMGSTYFVRGPKDCSRVGAYVQSIEKWRRKRLASTSDISGAPRDALGSRIMNDVDEYTL
jgi:hypothetical protein